MNHDLRNTCFIATLIASCLIGGNDVFGKGHSEYWEQRVSLFDAVPVEKGDIVFLGNSITDGGEFSELFCIPGIKNRGISSDVITGVAERLHQVTDNAPRKIFLLIGINDISHNLSLDDLCQRYESLVKSIRKTLPTQNCIFSR